MPSGTWVGAEATLEVVVPPANDRLHFWALQVSVDDHGRRGGGGHLGLQWHPGHPGRTAVNWGGYRADGRELAGGTSALPSATGNANTRDLAWVPGRAYRLGIFRSPRSAPDGGSAWRGTVTDVATAEAVVVRDLYLAGTTVTSPTVWSEVFADCDAATVTVAWSDLTLIATDGTRVAVDAVRTSYQAVADGGCTTNDSSVAAHRFMQSTGAERRTSPGTVLRLGSSLDR